MVESEIGITGSVAVDFSDLFIILLLTCKTRGEKVSNQWQGYNRRDKNNMWIKDPHRNQDGGITMKIILNNEKVRIIQYNHNNRQDSTLFLERILISLIEKRHVERMRLIMFLPKTWCYSRGTKCTKAYLSTG